MPLSRDDAGTDPVAKGDFLTVAQAAEALGVSTPRLRRLLARPEWAERTETRTRQTRTGTRTGTVLNRSLLDVVRADLESMGAPVEGPLPETEREREQFGTRTGTGTRTRQNENGNESNGSGELFQLREKLAALTAERDGLKERLTDTQAERDAWKGQAGSYGERLTLALEALRQAQDETRAARLVPAGRGPGLIASQETTGGDSGATTPQKAADAPPAPRKAPWWRFGKGG